MDPLTLLAGGGLLLAGILIGRFTHHQSKGRPDGPTCGCGHDIAYHDPKTGVCNQTVRWPETFARTGYDAQCTCKQYSGPKPLESYYAEGISE